MNGSLDTFDNMHNSQVCDGSEDCKIIQDISKLGMSANEGKCAADDGDGMRYTACSTRIFSEMATLESIPTLPDANFFDNPVFEELPETTTLSDNDVRARKAALSWWGKNLNGVQANALQKCASPTSSSKFNFRRLQMPKKQREKIFEQVKMATKGDKIEFKGGPVAMFFNDARKQSDEDFGPFDDYDAPAFLSSDASFLDAHEVHTAAGKASDHTLLIGVSRIDKEACVQASSAKKVVSDDIDLCTAPLKQPSSLEPCERSNTMHSMTDMSLFLDSSVLAGPPGRALRKKRAAAMFV